MTLRASFMVTCIGDAIFPRVGVAAVQVLEALGVRVDFPEAQTCCGQPAYNTGLREDARRSARAFLRAFEDSEHVVSISGSCTAMVRHGYPDLFRGLPEEGLAAGLATRTYEFSQFLCDVLGIEALPVSRPGRVTLHHSCHTRRLLGVSEQPELVLGMVRDLEYVPLPRSQDCCGFGGTFSVKMPLISAAMADEKVDHVLETGADTLVGLDMSCLMNIEGRLRRRASDVEVLHLAELLWQGWMR
jgi:L-lactate dehydrogenase complex protein LldE